MSFVSMGRFIPRYFFLFAVLSGMVSLISLSDFLLFVYQNARDFYILILYPATLLNFLCTVLGFPGGSVRKKICLECRVWPLYWEDPLEKGTATHSSILAWRIPWTERTGRHSMLQTVKRVLFLFQSGFLLGFFFACLTRTSNTMFNNSGKSGHPFLFLILEEMLSVFTIEWPLLCWVRFLLCLISGEFFYHI